MCTDRSILWPCCYYELFYILTPDRLCEISFFHLFPVGVVPLSSIVVTIYVYTCLLTFPGNERFHGVFVSGICKYIYDRMSFGGTSWSASANVRLFRAFKFPSSDVYEVLGQLTFKNVYFFLILSFHRHSFSIPVQMTFVRSLIRTDP